MAAAAERMCPEWIRSEISGNGQFIYPELEKKNKQRTKTGGSSHETEP